MALSKEVVRGKVRTHRSSSESKTKLPSPASLLILQKAEKQGEGGKGGSGEGGGARRECLTLQSIVRGSWKVRSLALGGS